MGIEHRMKDEVEADYWKCLQCGAVNELIADTDHCPECGEPNNNHYYPATWQDFWEYCQRLKT